jgi:hypothetical protein
MDSGDAINAAIQYASDNKIGIVLIPGGTYILEAPLRPLTAVHVTGVGVNTILKVKNNTDIDAIYTDHSIFAARLSNLNVDVNKQNNSFPNKGNGLNLHMSQCIIEHMRFRNVKRIGMMINDDGSISESLGYLNFIQYNHIEDCEDGIKWSWRTTDSWCQYNNIGSTRVNLHVQGGSNRFIGNHLNGNPEYNVYLPDGVDTVMFWNNLMENAGKHAFYAPRVGFPNAVRKINISSNLIRAASREMANTYNLVHIEGYDNDIKSKGITITGNTFANTTGNTVKHTLYIKDSDGVLITGNDFTDSYTEPEPISLINCINAEVSANIK